MHPALREKLPDQAHGVEGVVLKLLAVVKSRDRGGG
jgi:hypothetical protein